MSFLFMALLIVPGVLALAVAALGALRLPDFYTRSHAIGVMDTLGTLLILGGVAAGHGFSFTSAKLIILIVFIYIANPTVTHVLIRAAVRSGLRPWTLEDGGKP